MKKLLAKSKAFQLDRAFKLTGATALAQLVSYAAMPILSRIFSVDDYSILALFSSWMLPLVVLSTLRIEFSIPDSEDLAEAMHRRNVAMKVSLVFSICVLLVVSILYVFGITRNSIVWLLPLGVLFTAWVQIFNFYTTRTEEFTLNSVVRIVGNLAVSGLSLLIGFYFYNTHGLVLGLVVGQLVSLVVFLLFVKQKPQSYLQKEVSIRPEALRKFRKYIFYNTPNGLLEVLQLSLIIFFLDSTFGSLVTGSFYLCWRILQAPATLVSSTIFLAQYSKAAELNRSGHSFHKMILSTFLLLFSMSLPFIVLMYFFGQELFVFVFGSEWIQAGQFASVLILFFGLNFAVAPFNYVSLIKGKHKQQLIVSAVDLLTRCLAFYIGYTQGSAQLAITLFSIAGSVFCLIYLAWYYRLAKGENPL
ncbi:MAG: lipopolysaccharide biosynthesis protein [Flavobacteriales bacterium]